ncbi:MAG: hypothetical protein LBO03_02385, partial [Acidaminococcales bacterium]|nr:hypothetical protein [Acidaminococcales bacterium]
MRRLGKMPRSLKSVALGAGVAFLFLGAPPARASSDSFNGDAASGSKLATFTTGATEWFYSSLFGSPPSISGLLFYGSNNEWDVAGTDPNCPTFVFGGIAQNADNANITGNTAKYSGGSNKASVLVGGVSYTGDAAGNKADYAGGGLEGHDLGGTLYAVIGGLVSGTGAAGSAKENEVSVTGGGDIAGSIAGGVVLDTVSTGHASGNTVDVTAENAETLTIGASGSAAHVVGGLSLGSGNTAKNSVAVANNGTGTLTVYGDIVGGRVDGDGDAEGNKVAIKNLDGHYSAYGGQVNGDGDVAGNEILIEGGSAAIWANVAGGQVKVNGNAEGNKVTIKNLDGGYSACGGQVNGDGNVTGNEILIEGGSAADGRDVAGGWVDGDGNVEGNKVAIKNLDSGYLVYGGLVNGDGNVTGNEILIEGGSAADGRDVVGGIVSGGKAEGNKITIKNLNGGYSVSGGFVQAGSALGNEIWIEGGTVSGWGSFVGGIAVGGKAEGNKITIKNLNGNYGGYGGQVLAGSASGNEIWIEGGSVSWADVVGGRVDGNGKAEGNKVNIKNSDGGYFVYGGRVTGEGNAEGNKVTITDSLNIGSVYGGWAGNGNASKNEISLIGGVGTSTTINAGATISGGHVGSGGRAANNNIVTLTGGIGFANTILCGYSGAGTGSGNILRLYNIVQTGSINNVSNFDAYDFKIDYAKVGGFALTAENVTMSAAATIQGIEITGGGNNRLAAGDTVGLIEATTSFGGGIAPQTVKGSQGVFHLYDFDVAQSGNYLIATVKSSWLNPAAKALSEGRLAGPAFLNQGADLLEKEGIKEAGRQARREQGPAVFAAMGYSDTRHNTGSYVDVKGPSLLVGLSFAKGAGSGARLTYGGFLEAGWGSYDSYNSFSGRDEVRGDGDTNYYGIGFLARRENAKRGDGRLYTEGS